MSNSLSDISISRKSNLDIEISNENPDKILSDFLDQWKEKKNLTPTQFFALGGIGEVGKNTYCIEYDDEIILIDAGIKFANKKLFPGITGTVAPMDYLLENQEKVKALFITHGHEDHIGGIVYCLKKIKIPVIYSPIIASELIKKKLNEHKINNQKIVLFQDNSFFKTKYFFIDFYKVNHSIPDAFGIFIATPNGNIVSSADFRFDFASKTDKLDLQKVQKISQRKIDLFLCESTNAEQPNFNSSEKVVITEIHNIISSSSGRVIITFFSSNLARIEEIIKIAIVCKRKILILGRSIDNSINSSIKVGYLKINKKIFINSNEISNYKDNEILIICTGSQGEENAVLSNISKHKYFWMKLKPTDNIIFSSNIIPGNTLLVEELINRLYKIGCNIFLNKSDLKIHSSGHASKLEQQLLINLINPKYLIPIHGEVRMLKKLKRNCLEIGFPESNIFILQNGDVVNLLNSKLSFSEKKINNTPVYIMGTEMLENGIDILDERKKLGKNGILMIHLFLNFKNKEIINISPITNIGSFYLSESIHLLKKISGTLHSKIKFLLNEKLTTTEDIKNFTHNLIKNEVFSFNKQKPHILVFIDDCEKEEIFKNSISANIETNKEEKK